MATAEGKATLKEIFEFFGKDSFAGGLSEFRKQWMELSEGDRAQIAFGIGNGTLTY